MSLLLCALVLANGSPVLFDDPLAGAAGPGWRVAPASFAPAPDGRAAARYARGTTWSSQGQPWVGDASWSTYRIEVEVWPETMWSGIDFHVQDDGRSATEVTVFRVDGKLALELSGIWGEASAWKLWPVGQKVEPHPGGWVSLRLDIGVGVVNAFVGEECVATWRDLPFRSGGIRLAAYHGSGLFRKLRVTALDAAAVVGQLPDAWQAAGAGVLRDWKVSPRFAPGSAPAQPPIDDGTWRSPIVDERGVVHVTALLPEANASGVVFARTTLRSEAAGEARLWLTYTDGFSLWCNGQRIWDGPPRQWFHPDRARNGNSRLIPNQYEVTVPVKAGDNELVVRSETSEPFGWGFWIRRE